MISALALLLAAQTPGIQLAAPENFDDLATVFGNVCVSPFPSAPGFASAVENSGFDFEKQPRIADSRNPGNRWLSGQVMLSYLDADWAPPRVPSPQCAMQVVMPVERDHLTLAADLAKRYGLANGRSRGRGGDNATRWDIAADNGERYRLFFRSKPAGTGLYDLKLTLLRLRSDEGDDDNDE